MGVFEKSDTPFFSVKEELLCVQNGCFIMFDTVLFRFNHTISEQDLSAENTVIHILHTIYIRPSFAA